MGKYGIPDDVLARLRERDKSCVYCRKQMVFPYDLTRRADSATIEHLGFDGPGYWHEGLKEEGLAYCCGACNSSRGPKSLADWFVTSYCVQRNINTESVAEPVQKYLKTIAESKS